jgi:gamma-glutamylcyclotransferase (GGCT)/AIG2-like uncharacterized protein YtfP
MAIGAGSIAATLLDLGDYPGAVEAPGAAGSDAAGMIPPVRGAHPADGRRVRGQLFAIAPEGATALFAALDAFEGVEALRPEAGEFRREAVDVLLDGKPGSVVAEAYLFNRGAPDAPIIPSGDWLGYLAARE